MKVTKYTHACIVLEEQGDKLIIDPGAFTELPNDLTNVKAIIITHIHDDHLGVENITKIIADNPEVEIIACHDVIEKLGNIAASMVAITDYSVRTAGGFRLELSIGDHAVVYDKVPCQNLRVLVNEQVYHPGDSLVPYNKEVALLCVPLSAPWCKVSEVIDFVNASQAKQCIPIHDALLSELGAGFYNSWIDGAVQRKGAEYTVLQPGQSLDI